MTATAPVLTDAFTAYDASFSAVTGSAPQVMRVVEVDAHEGPVYVPEEDALYFTTTPRRGARALVKRLALDGDRFPLEPDRISIVPGRLAMPNGMTADHDGALVVCDQGGRADAARLSRVDPRTGQTTTVVDAWHGLPLNSPNDVVVQTRRHDLVHRPELRLPAGLPARARGRGLTSTATTRSAAGSTSSRTRSCKPNGIAFSPDEQTLYVTDSGANQEPGSFHPDLPHHIVAFDVARRTSPWPGRGCSPLSRPDSRTG